VGFGTLWFQPYQGGVFPESHEKTSSFLPQFEHPDTVDP
jgi:hypothetical protein